MGINSRFDPRWAGGRIAKERNNIVFDLIAVVKQRNDCCRSCCFVVGDCRRCCCLFLAAPLAASLFQSVDSFDQLLLLFVRMTDGRIGFVPLLSVYASRGPSCCVRKIACNIEYVSFIRVTYS